MPRAVRDCVDYQPTIERRQLGVTENENEQEDDWCG